MPEEKTFEINHPGENGAGIIGYYETVKISVEHGPGGEPGEFMEYMRQCLLEWFDGATVLFDGGERGRQ